ncbi:hypothetical protein [Caldimonas brevitalea]|uniref:YkuD domain-containing protein n=1 Tax=Caldimonas brevitalea TaxID=413882 RepID=A0A0G3BSC4_9BURK|nr:hypothetical protein [Caldimonas brevitalea]AKJ29450.1 hypothetical protein AAW51_2759 [Caldimonas brevitalea]
MPEMRYIVGGSDGWLRIKREPGSEIISVPEYLQVALTSSSNGRDFITLQEGPHKDKKFSVTTGNLSARKPDYTAAAHLTFSLSREVVRYALGTVKAITDSSNPVPEGLHPIQIPDHPHHGGLRYEARSAYAKTWFYLGHGDAIARHGDRYLHTGARSAGCITVDPQEWTQFYRYLILCRSGNGKTVGSVTVVR